MHNLLVNWDHMKLNMERLSLILYCMGSKLVCMFFKFLAQDYKTWCYGMPDLILWREDEKRVKFVEVKSEADHLSDQQKAWISNITHMDVEVELCQISCGVEGVDVF